MSATHVRPGTSARRVRVQRVDARQIKSHRGNEQFARDMAYMQSLVDAKRIIEGAARQFDSPEWRSRNAHHCNEPINCALHPKACAAINQNMPLHMIEGQML